VQRLAVERAAVMLALAEDAASRRLGGDLTISLEDVVRLEGAASRAMNRLGLDRRMRKPEGSTLSSLLQGTFGAPRSGEEGAR
jgi:hypothetical protein